MAKVAIMGCGRWGSNHLKTLAKLREEGLVENITVIDPSLEARQKATLADITKADLDGLDADLVIIATPPKHHSQQAKDLISKGFHVLVEKPLGCSEIEAAEVVSFSQEYGKIVSVGLLLRFHPIAPLAKHYIDSGLLGRVESIRFVRRTKRPQPANGNVIESLGVHGIDLACYLMSETEPTCINVQGDKMEAEIAVEFPHGIEALIDVCWGASKERRFVEVNGSISSLKFYLDVHNEVVLVKNGKEEKKLIENNMSPLECELRHVISCVKAHQEGANWSVIPDQGAALRGVRLTEIAMQKLPMSWPH